MHQAQYTQEKMEEIIAWVQEYANLCTVASICPANKQDLATNIKQLLIDTIKRGNFIINQFANNKTREVNHTQSQNNNNSNNKVRPFIPLSGISRFDENFDYNKTTPLIPNSTQYLPSHDLKPSKNYLQKKNAS